ncbi:dihydrolipoyl dehydrogenase [Methylobacterium sp. NEAU 140]|uniref:dihydrolipoyl dehydrogenase n=1 Tax=Methylobacterium sp. NEAU 140 TaxID=3064945 RepID=UPI002732FE69|nr:dihydrolipoyl dehydrogenase [Methylobacterium sp. NEAU 140]MDP4026405.1 dihydrolipoyl dehydrogenase [Methylobacterium sp. NEAU 140]
MREIECDVAVIGAGTAGIAAYRAAAEAGAHAVLIERGPGGTTCARVGCMPSKLLIAAGEAAHAARGADLFGVRVSGVAVDGPAVLARLRAERDRFVGAVFDSLDAIPADRRIAGHARFRDRGSLAVGDACIVRYRAAVIATGSSPAVPEPLRGLGARVLTTDTLFEIPNLPASLAVLGLGPVGIELAQALARLGVRVTALDSGRTIAGLTEPDLVGQAAALFADAMDLHLGARLDAAEAAEGGVRLSWTCDGASGATSGSATVERVLAAAGRPPNIRDLGLETTGLRLDADGMPAFDARSLVCADAPILIAGDADGWRPVLHEASRQGRIAGANAAALAAGRSTQAPEPWPSLAMVFTHPQAAAFGAPYDPDARDRITGSADFSDQGRARVEGVNRGGIRLWAGRDGRLFGGEMFGPAVEHLAHLLSGALRDGLTAQALRDRPIYHPTVEEGVETALSEIIRKVSAE